MKENVIKEIFDFFVNSNDFNGIVLTNLAKKLKIKYKIIIPIIRELIEEDIVSIQFGENPHIIRFGHFEKDRQLEYLKGAENNKVKVIKTIKPKGFTRKINTIKITSESHSLCVYPSANYLNQHYTITTHNTPYSNRLALGEAHIKPVFFELDVLERYFLDPRYRFKFEDYFGDISIAGTENTPSLLQEKDQVFLKTFGLGYDDQDNRVAVVYLRYLKALSPEHQTYWHSKELNRPCKMTKEYYSNTILGDWSFGQSIFSAVIEEHRIINEMSFLIKNKYLFRETFEEHKRPKEFTFFNSPTLRNYENFISLLDKMISENINKDFFNNEIEAFELLQLSEGMVERKQKGTLTMLDEWIRKNYSLHDPIGYELLMKPFKAVRRERQNPAHRISENYYDKNLYTKQMDLLKEVYSSFGNLRYILKQHRSTASFKIPGWLDNGSVKDF